MFARKPSPDLARLVKAIDEKTAATNGAAAAFVVYLPADADADAVRADLEAQATKDKLTATPLTLRADEADAAKKFNLTVGDDMPVNVLVYRGKKVTKAFSLKEIKDADVTAVATAVEENSK